MCLHAIEAIRQTDVNPARCATDAGAVLALWRALRRPSPAELASEVAIVAEWARDAPDRLAARDIRAVGWAEGADRCRSVSTLTVQKSWGDRLAAATAWVAAGRPKTVPVKGRGEYRPSTPKEVNNEPWQLTDEQQAKVDSWSH